MQWHQDLTYRGFILMQDLVVLGHGHAENDRRDILEAMYPLLTLRTLAAHIEQSVGQNNYINIKYL